MIYRSRGVRVPRVWGSLRSDTGEAVGEIWWIHHGAGGSTLLDPLGRGRATSISELVSGGLLPGDPWFPLLVKTLHTADRLSIQVHPGASGEELRKEETWIVLEAGLEAWMLAGFSRQTTRSELRKALLDGGLPDLLALRRLERGDVVHLPPGTVHSLGPGCTVLEIQTNCDVTYRLYDWDRPGSDGRPRRLDTGEGLDAADLRPGAGPVPGTGDSRWNAGVVEDYSLLPVSGPRELDLPPHHVFFLTDGSIGEGPERLESRCCLVADSEGGMLRLDGSAAGWMTGAR